MGSLKKLAVLSLFGVLLFLCLLGRAEAQSIERPKRAPAPRSLFAQSAIQVLDHEFGDNRISYLLLDAQTEVLLSSRWEDSSRPIPLGSLVKPFTALAYAEAHDFQYPMHVCKGEASGCWQAHPHGELDIVSAITFSCNSYFRELVANLNGDQLAPTIDRFGLEPPNPGLTGASLMGLGDQWLISPLHMARAYLELYRRRDQPGVRELLTGMAQSAEHGTGAGVGRALRQTDALVKTGTAPCTHLHPAPADGFVVALVPASQPEILLLIRVHGVAGAKAAVTAGRMLKRMEE
jgi:hypothetical protein